MVKGVLRDVCGVWCAMCDVKREVLYLRFVKRLLACGLTAILSGLFVKSVDSMDSFCAYRFLMNPHASIVLSSFVRSLARFVGEGFFLI